MSGSDAEREIRTAVVDWLRKKRPNARIVHELVVGSCRADLAAIDLETITLVEIKSAKDNLNRLERQVREFNPSCHRLIVVADRKWFETFNYLDGSSVGIRPKPALVSLGHNSLWCYPEVKQDEFSNGLPWRLPSLIFKAEPRAANLLSLLWRIELLDEAKGHGLLVNSRTTRPTLIKEMAWGMTGQQVARAVCRQLRTRHFPMADTAVDSALAA